MRIIAMIVAIGASILSPPALARDGCGTPMKAVPQHSP